MRKNYVNYYQKGLTAATMNTHVTFPLVDYGQNTSGGSRVTNIHLQFWLDFVSVTLEK